MEVSLIINRAPRGWACLPDGHRAIHFYSRSCASTLQVLAGVWWSRIIFALVDPVSIWRHGNWTPLFFRDINFLTWLFYKKLKCSSKREAQNCRHKKRDFLFCLSLFWVVNLVQSLRFRAAITFFLVLLPFCTRTIIPSTKWLTAENFVLPWNKHAVGLVCLAPRPSAFLHFLLLSISQTWNTKRLLHGNPDTCSVYWCPPLEWNNE